MKKKFNLESIFVFLFLTLFPLGQVIRIGVIHPIDIVAGLGALYALITKQKKPDIFKHLENFLLFVIISWIFGIFIFKTNLVLYGLLYLLRLVSYIYFLIYVWNFAREEKNKNLLLNSLLSVSFVSAIFGWIQMFTVPDLKPFFDLGWDMHLFRLVGTFLDPTFLGLIIVFGLILSIHRFIDSKSWKYVLISVFLLISLAFTYSRASYLALFAVLAVIGYQKKIFKQLLLVATTFIVLTFLLPTSKNHSIELLRSFSAIARLDNYKSTLTIFTKSPVFGIGYNNMCIAYNKYIGPQNFSSHACSGSDSSILFILATTGVVGFIVFIYSLFKIKNNLKHSTYYTLLTTSFIALIVHSVFSNSVFYPWILGWVIILLAMAITTR